MEQDPEELSVKETLRRGGFDTRADAMRYSHRRGTIPACCTCGAHVEPDGRCQHDNPSVLRKAGLV